MLSTGIQYVFIFHSTCCICDSRVVILGQLTVVVEINSSNVGEKPTLYTYINHHAGTSYKKQKQKQCITSSNMVVIVYCFIGCRDKTSTWYLNGFHLNGFPDGTNLGSTVQCGGKAHRYTVHVC